MGDIAELFDPFLEPDDDYYGDEDANVKCKFCGEQGLEWFHTGLRWRLVDGDGEFHVCKNAHPSTIDDFEVIE